MVFAAGHDYLENSADVETYTIDCNDWAEKIIVYGDKDLRDKIVRLLNESDCNGKPITRPVVV